MEKKSTKRQKVADFAISFNPDTRQGFMGDEDGGPETALIFFGVPCGKDGETWTGRQYYLLKGDFQKEYEEIIANGGSRYACKAFYDEQKRKHGSRWSSDFQEWGKDGRCRKRRKRHERKVTREEVTSQ